jgi:hypothetical protein
LGEVFVGYRRLNSIKVQRIREIQNYFEYQCTENFSKDISLKLLFETSDGREIDTYEITKSVPFIKMIINIDHEQNDLNIDTEEFSMSIDKEEDDHHELIKPNLDSKDL